LTLRGDAFSECLHHPTSVASYVLMEQMHFPP